MDYLLKSTICLTAFYGLYFFGFRRMSFHTLNRFYLLASLALSLTIPLLSYERTEIVMLEPQPIQETTFAVEETQKNSDNQASAIPEPSITDEVPETTINWISILTTIYLMGVGAMLIMFVKNLLTIFYSIKRASVDLVASASLSHQKQSKKLKILCTKSQSNSSFFNYVFLNPDNLNPHEKVLIIAHEGFHAQRLHTLDLLLSNILKAVFWFNPIVYFYQKSLKQIHEYEVDALMSATYDGREYAHLLLKLGVAPNAMIINQFSTKPLSERIQFLFKTPTKNMKKLLYFLSLPIIAVGVMAFAEERVNTIYKQKSAGKTIPQIEVKEYPLVINDEKNRASWNNSFDSFRFSPTNISLNKIQIKNYNGFHYYVNPNSLTINMIEQVNKFIGKRFLALIITEKEIDAQGNLNKLGLAIKHLRTNQVSPTEVFDMAELREKGKMGGYFIIEGYDRNFKASGILFNEGSDDLTISQGELRVMTLFNKTSDIIITKTTITYKVSPDKFNLATLEKVKSYFTKEGFNLKTQNPIFDNNKKLISVEIQLDNGQGINKKQIVLDDLRHLVRSKNRPEPTRWDETIIIEANKITKETNVFVDNRWLEGIKKSDKFEILKVSSTLALPKIDSTKFSYNTEVKVPKSQIDSFKVIVNQQFLIEGKDYIVKNNIIYLDPSFKAKGYKIAYHLFSKSEGPIIYPELTKLDKVSFSQLKNTSNINLTAKNENIGLYRYTSFQTRPSTPFSNVAKKQDTLRTILETNKLGKNPLVFINGEEYPSSILYRINPDNIRGSQIYSKGSQRAIEKYGLRAEDGVVILNTVKNKELLLENDKQYRITVDNVKKQLNAPKKRVQRVVLKDLDGKEYEKVSVMRPDFSAVHFSVDVPIGGKVIFTVDGKVVNEEDIENAKQLYIGGGCGQTHGGKYDAYIELNTK